MREPILKLSAWPSTLFPHLLACGSDAFVHCSTDTPGYCLDGFICPLTIISTRQPKCLLWMNSLFQIQSMIRETDRSRQRCLINDFLRFAYPRIITSFLKTWEPEAEDRDLPSSYGMCSEAKMECPEAVGASCSHCTPHLLEQTEGFPLGTSLLESLLFHSLLLLTISLSPYIYFCLS